MVPKKNFFQRVWGGGGVDNTRGNSGGVDGLFLWSKNGNSLEEGGLMLNSHHGGGMDKKILIIAINLVLHIDFES